MLGGELLDGGRDEAARAAPDRRELRHNGPCDAHREEERDGGDGGGQLSARAALVRGTALVGAGAGNPLA